MTVPLDIVAAAFSCAALFCLIDIFKAVSGSRKLFRFFQAIILAFAAGYYWSAAAADSLPAMDLRFVWVCLCIVTCAEVISRWPLGRKK